MKYLSRFIISRLLLISEIAIQINIIVESVEKSNSLILQVNKPEINPYIYNQYVEKSIDQSELAIVIASLFIAFSLLVFIKTKYFLAKGAWSVTLAGLLISIGSLVLRHFESGLYTSDLYYHSFSLDSRSYNTATNLMIISIIICIPYGFCKTDKYYNSGKKTETSQVEPASNPSHNMIYRPHQDEAWHYKSDGSIEYLPTYFEMKRPPVYRAKSCVSIILEGDECSIISSNSSSASHNNIAPSTLSTVEINNEQNVSANNSVIVDMHSVGNAAAAVEGSTNSVVQTCATNKDTSSTDT